MTAKMTEVAIQARKCGFALGLFVAQREAHYLGHFDMVRSICELVTSGAFDKLALMSIEEITVVWDAMKRTGNPVLIKKEEADG